MGRNGRVWAEQHHSPQAGAKNIEALMLEIIEKKEVENHRRKNDLTSPHR